MAEDSTDSLFRRYRGLIGYAAGMYAAHPRSIVDPEDLFQAREKLRQMEA